MMNKPFKPVSYKVSITKSRAISHFNTSWNSEKQCSISWNNRRFALCGESRLLFYFQPHNEKRKPKQCQWQNSSLWQLQKHFIWTTVKIEHSTFSINESNYFLLKTTKLMFLVLWHGIIPDMKHHIYSFIFLSFLYIKLTCE